jgi:hypothetical protein
MADPPWGLDLSHEHLHASRLVHGAVRLPADRETINLRFGNSLGVLAPFFRPRYPADMQDEPMGQAATDEVVQALAFALRYDGRRRVHHADDVMATYSSASVRPPDACRPA